MAVDWAYHFAAIGPILLGHDLITFALQTVV